MNCVVKSNFIQEMVVMTLAPIFVLLLILVIDQVYEVCQPEKKHEIRSHFSHVVLIFSFIIFPSVSTKIFQTFSCDTLDNRESFMRVDYSVDCNSVEYDFAQTWAVIMILFYPLGIPLSYFCILFGNRKSLNPSSKVKEDEEGREERNQLAIKIQERMTEIFEEDENLTFETAKEKAKAEVREEDESIDRFKFLFDAYEPQMWWWEVFECLRRLMLTGMLIFCLDGTAGQIVIGMLLSLVASRCIPSTILFWIMRMIGCLRLSSGRPFLFSSQLSC